MRILLTGASGRIGGNLLTELKKSHEVVAVSRSTKNKDDEEKVTWVAADLFAPEDNERIMQDIDLAIYLVHSMRPKAKLTQASFQDMDALLAENFARAAANNGVKRIVYLSDAVPQEEKKLSKHLARRLEREKILGSFGVPVTTLRIKLTDHKPQDDRPLKKDVRSIQRITIPEHWSVKETADYYLRWLSRASFKVVGTSVLDNHAEIRLPLIRKPILALDYSPERSRGDAAAYMISGGLLTKANDEGRARLVFRRVLDTNQVIIAIHEYEPALPWWFYTLTQARVHLVVMTLFGCETAVLARFYQLTQKFPFADLGRPRTV